MINPSILPLPNTITHRATFTQVMECHAPALVGSPQAVPSVTIAMTNSPLFYDKLLLLQLTLSVYVALGFSALETGTKKGSELWIIYGLDPLLNYSSRNIIGRCRNPFIILGEHWHWSWCEHKHANYCFEFWIPLCAVFGGRSISQQVLSVFVAMSVGDWIFLNKKMLKYIQVTFIWHMSTSS